MNSIRSLGGPWNCFCFSCSVGYQILQTIWSAPHHTYDQPLHDQSLLYIASKKLKSKIRPSISRYLYISVTFTRTTHCSVEVLIVDLTNCIAKTVKTKDSKTARRMACVRVYRRRCHCKCVGKLCFSWAQDILCMEQRICRRSKKTKFSLSALTFQLFWALFRDYSRLLVLSINRWPAKLLDSAMKSVFPQCRVGKSGRFKKEWHWPRYWMRLGHLWLLSTARSQQSKKLNIFERA